MNKELLLKDLCARLPYGLVINTGDEDLKLDRQHQGIGILYPENCSDEFNKRSNNASFYIIISGCYYGEDIKPYLRPMSSMTEEERDEMKQLLNPDGTGWFTTEGFIIPASHYGDMLNYSFLDDIGSYLDSKHLDHRSLIPKGLALEAPEGMYK